MPELDYEKLTATELVKRKLPGIIPKPKKNAGPDKWDIKRLPSEIRVSSDALETDIEHLRKTMRMNTINHREFTSKFAVEPLVYKKVYQRNKPTYGRVQHKELEKLKNKNPHVIPQPPPVKPKNPRKLLSNEDLD